MNSVNSLDVSELQPELCCNCVSRNSLNTLSYSSENVYMAKEAALKKLRRTITALGVLLDIGPIQDCINVQNTKVCYRTKIAYGVKLVSYSDLGDIQGCARIEFLNSISLICIRLVFPTVWKTNKVQLPGNRAIWYTK